jgi:hypothetical protein
VADRITFALGDVVDGVDGDFDLIVFDPPFRWFKPRDLLEAGSTDENYRALTRFIAQVKGRLRPNGRVLLNFGTTADIDYLYSLIRNADEAGAAPLRRGNQGWVYGPLLRHHADGLTLGSPWIRASPAHHEPMVTDQCSHSWGSGLPPDRVTGLRPAGLTTLPRRRSSAVSCRAICASGRCSPH